MLPANGLYGLTKSNRAKSVALVGGLFAVLLILPTFLFALYASFMWLAGALYAGGLLPDAALFREYFGNSRAPVGVWIPPTETIVAVYALVCAAGLVGFTIAIATFHLRLRRATRARPIARNEANELHNIVENLAIVAGTPMPSLEIIETSALNAYAYGFTQGGSTIAVTRGLLTNLTRTELQAVLAHELTHIRQMDVRLMSLVAAFARIEVPAAPPVYGRRLDLTRYIIMLGFILVLSGHNWIAALATNPMQFAGVILLVIAWVGVKALQQVPRHISALMYRMISKAREFLADAGAVELTKEPQALVSALRKIASNDGIAHVPDAFFAMMISAARGAADATHPAIEDRIAALSATPQAAGTQASFGRRPSRVVSSDLSR